MDYETLRSHIREASELGLGVDETTEYLMKAGYDREELMDYKTAYNLLLESLKEWVVMEDIYYPIVATWLISTYHIDDFPTFPILLINAQKRSGKTRLLKFGAFMTTNGVYTMDMTEAVLFRMPAAMKCSLFIDEAERMGGKEKKTLRTMLNAVYKKGLKIFRTRKNKQTEQYEIDSFDVFVPVGIANIKGVDDVLEDRCISIIMERSNNPNVVNKPEIFHLDSVLLYIKKIINEVSESSVVSVDKSSIYMIYRHLLNTTLTTHYTLTPHTTLTTLNNNNNNNNNKETLIDKIMRCGIVGRDLELWLPLIVMRYMIDEESIDDFIDIGREMASRKKIDDMVQDTDTSFLVFLSDMITEQNQDQFFSATALATSYRENEDIKDARYFNAKRLGKIAKRLKVIVEKRRLSRGIEIRFNRAKILNKCKMMGYVPSTSEKDKTVEEPFKLLKEVKS